MGVKSVLKKIGKVALKVAPYAALAIPGIGIPASMAISAASKVADTKLSGGSWKNALIQGGISGGLAGVGAGALKGIGPSSSALAKMGAGAVGKTAGTGFAGAAGRELANMGTQAALSKVDGAPKYATSGSGSGTGSSGGGSIFKQIAAAKTPPTAANTGGNRNGVMPRGGYNYRNNPMNQLDQSNPNLSQSIFQGRQEAIRNQPFRTGYDVNTLHDDETISTSRMPPIYQNTESQKRKKRVPRETSEVATETPVTSSPVATQGKKGSIFSRVQRRQAY